MAVSVILIMTSLIMTARPYQDHFYKRHNGEIYYGNRLVVNADSNTFEDLGYGYGRDAYHVFRYGEVLEYVDPSTFRVDPYFSCDHNGYYTGGNWDDGYRPGREEYYITDFDVFYRGRKIKNANASSFEILQRGYAKDSFNVYYRGEKMSGVTSSSFEYLGDGYAKDSFRVYWDGAKINGANASSFKVTGRGYAEDSFNTYYRGRKIN